MDPVSPLLDAGDDVRSGGLAMSHAASLLLLWLVTSVVTATGLSTLMTLARRDLPIGPRSTIR